LEDAVLSREDLLFTIGYDGANAVVDGKAKAANARLSTMELAGRGLYRAAYTSALLSGDAAEMASFVEYFGALVRGEYKDASQLGRLFGVEEHAVKRALVL
jgi:hypothetical protein